jgi:hypothetical protein
MKRSTKFYFKNEKEVMQSLGLKPTKGSGSGWIEKEDGQNEYIIAQLKSTDSNSYRISLDDLHKLEHNAIVAHKTPTFIIQFLKTRELYMVSKVEDVQEIAKYLETGSCAITMKDYAAIAELFEYEKTKVEKIIKSSDRGKKEFWEEREENFKKCRKQRLK